MLRREGRSLGLGLGLELGLGLGTVKLRAFWPGEGSASEHSQHPHVRVGASSSAGPGRRLQHDTTGPVGHIGTTASYWITSMISMVVSLRLRCAFRGAIGVMQFRVRRKVGVTTRTSAAY